MGLAAVAIALAPILGAPTAQSHGWILTTVGISAIAFGIRARRIDHWSALVRSASAVGIGSGAVATAAMIALVILATSQNGPPSFAAVRPQIAAPVASRVVGAPVQSEQPGESVERTTSWDLVLSANAIGFTLRNAYGSRGPWPAALTENAAHQVVVPATGQLIATVPAGVTVTYLPSGDRSTFSLRVSLDSDPTKHADLDSTADSVTQSR